jgi:hypothetical protein
MENDDINPFMDEKDAEKFFDQDKYSTFLINTEEFSKKNKSKVGDLVQLLTTTINEDKVEALKLIKQHLGKELLLEAISQPEYLKQRAVLVSACWESGLDFTAFFDFFFYLTLISDYQTTLEAITVIESMEEQIPATILKIALEKVDEALLKENNKKFLFEDLKVHLQERQLF